VQGTHRAGRLAGIVGSARPVLQADREFTEQLLGFFLEDREQLDVDRIGGVDVLVVVEMLRCAAKRCAPRFGLGGRGLRQRLQRG
jgi:hypothetical protein